MVLFIYHVCGIDGLNQTLARIWSTIHLSRMSSNCKVMEQHCD